eukprot:TRINITY_DN366_c0_g3_i1.p1 TRINITY_DN366_c0_g3~~TRINITY_DN366_c0_g3_i1.p1  ORF type:complete len:114 (-),score=3.86 TRINITY_DN366_c0_g3_i1:74-415(-)
MKFVLVLLSLACLAYSQQVTLDCQHCQMLISLVHNYPAFQNSIPDILSKGYEICGVIQSWLDSSYEYQCRQMIDSVAPTAYALLHDNAVDDRVICKTLQLCAEDMDSLPDWLN